VVCDLGYALRCLEDVHARRGDGSVASLLRHAPVHVVAVAMYTAHMASFATGLGPSAHTCREKVLETEWQLRSAQHPGQRLPLTERCVRIQWSIWLAGGFSVAGACLVTVLHVVTLAVRVGGVAREGGGAVREGSGDGGGDEACEAGGGETGEREGQGQDTVRGKTDWNEAFLECLVP